MSTSSIHATHTAQSLQSHLNVTARRVTQAAQQFRNVTNVSEGVTSFIGSCEGVTRFIGGDETAGVTVPGKSGAVPTQDVLMSQAVKDLLANSRRDVTVDPKTRLFNRLAAAGVLTKVLAHHESAGSEAECRKINTLKGKLEAAIDTVLERAEACGRCNAPHAIGNGVHTHEATDEALAKAVSRLEKAITELCKAPSMRDVLTGVMEHVVVPATLSVVKDNYAGLFTPDGEWKGKDPIELDQFLVNKYFIGVTETAAQSAAGYLHSSCHMADAIIELLKIPGLVNVPPSGDAPASDGTGTDAAPSAQSGGPAAAGSPYNYQNVNVNVPDKSPVIAQTDNQALSEIAKALSRQTEALEHAQTLFATHSDNIVRTLDGIIQKLLADREKFNGNFTSIYNTELAQSAQRRQRAAEVQTMDVRENSDSGADAEPSTAGRAPVTSSLTTQDKGTDASGPAAERQNLSVAATQTTATATRPASVQARGAETVDSIDWPIYSTPIDATSAAATHATATAAPPASVQARGAEAADGIDWPIYSTPIDVIDAASSHSIRGVVGDEYSDTRLHVPNSTDEAAVSERISTSANHQLPAVGAAQRNFVVGGALAQLEPTGAGNGLIYSELLGSASPSAASSAGLGKAISEFSATQTAQVAGSNSLIDADVAAWSTARTFVNSVPVADGLASRTIDQSLLASTVSSAGVAGLGTSEAGLGHEVSHTSDAAVGSQAGWAAALTTHDKGFTPRVDRPDGKAGWKELSASYARTDGIATAPLVSVTGNRVDRGLVNRGQAPQLLSEAVTVGVRPQGRGERAVTNADSNATAESAAGRSAPLASGVPTGLEQEKVVFYKRLTEAAATSGSVPSRAPISALMGGEAASGSHEKGPVSLSQAPQLEVTLQSTQRSAQLVTPAFGTDQRNFVAGGALAQLGPTGVGNGLINSGLLGSALPSVASSMGLEKAISEFSATQTAQVAGSNASTDADVAAWSTARTSVNSAPATAGLASRTIDQSSLAGTKAVAGVAGVGTSDAGLGHEVSHTNDAAVGSQARWAAAQTTHDKGLTPRVDRPDGKAGWKELSASYARTDGLATAPLASLAGDGVDGGLVSRGQAPQLLSEAVTVGVRPQGRGERAATNADSNATAELANGRPAPLNIRVPAGIVQERVAFYERLTEAAATSGSVRSRATISALTGGRSASGSREMEPISPFQAPQLEVTLQTTQRSAQPATSAQSATPAFETDTRRSSTVASGDVHSSASTTSLPAASATTHAASDVPSVRLSIRAAELEASRSNLRPTAGLATHVSTQSVAVSGAGQVTRGSGATLAGVLNQRSVPVSGQGVIGSASLSTASNASGDAATSSSASTLTRQGAVVGGMEQRYSSNSAVTAQGSSGASSASVFDGAAHMRIGSQRAIAAAGAAAGQQPPVTSAQKVLGRLHSSKIEPDAERGIAQMRDVTGLTETIAAATPVPHRPKVFDVPEGRNRVKSLIDSFTPDST